MTAYFLNGSCTGLIPNPRRVPSQTLLEPVTVELSIQETRLLEEQLPVMQALGFDLEPFGPNTDFPGYPTLLLGSDPLAHYAW